MIHERCLTYFNIALRECPHCGMLWCPRCRKWFPPDKMPALRAGNSRGTRHANTMLGRRFRLAPDTGR